MEFVWIVKYIWVVNEVWEKKYKIRQFVVEETSEKYPQSCCFQLFWEDKVWYLNNIRIWDEVEIRYNIKCRESNWKHYNSIDARAVKKLSSEHKIDIKQDDLPF